MWFLLLYLQISAIRGLNVALRGSDSPCKGRLEVRNSDGQWGLVCHYGWKRENGQVVCKSLKCGNMVDSGIERTLYKDPPPPNQYLMDQVNCMSTETSLWLCGFVGAKDLPYKNDGFVAVECNGTVELGLSLNGQRDKCAGVLDYTTQDGIFGVCNTDWNEFKAKKICQELKCGDHYHIPKPGLFKGQQSKENVLLNWDDKTQFSWQSMEESKKCSERASVICSNHRRFRLRDGNNLCSGFVEEYNVANKSWVPVQQEDVPGDICAQLNCGSLKNVTTTNRTNSHRLTCSGNVTLRNFTSKCFGEVNVRVNGSDYGVCYSGSNTKLGVVCKELGCGELLYEKEGRIISNGLLSNVECLGHEASLWHCLAKHEIKQCKSATVICAGSLDVRLSDGLGRCSGRVELLMEDSWKSIITSKDWTTVNSDVVCEHIKCGKSTSMPNQFIEGEQNQLESPWHFNCESDSAKLYECLKKEMQYLGSNKPNVQIMCQKEKLMFFEGDSPCKGRVLIKSFDGEAAIRPMADNKTGANDICRAMQCGDSIEMQNGTYVNVTCSGSVNVTLRNKPEKEKDERCWGTVEVCKNGICGGVCNDTWKIEHSERICHDLGCGKPIQSPLKSQIPTQYSESVTHYSVYCLNEMKNISMCRFSNTICKDPAQVICTGSVTAKLEDPRDKCAGTVSLSYAGQSRPVCQDTLNTNLSKAICRELNCGEFNTTIFTLRDKLQETGLSGIQCKSDANSVSECNLDGISETNSCTAGYLQCPDRKRLLLYKKKGSCSGPVYALSEGKTLLVSGQGWGREEGQKMCKYLQCGNYISHSTKTTGTTEWWRKTYNCSGKENIWECERDDKASQLSEHLDIKCEGKHAVMLSNTCKGNVSMDEDYVCATHLDDQMYSEICDNLGCGKAFHHWSTELKTEYLHFSCTGNETMLGQCSFKKYTNNNLSVVACQKGIEFGSTEKCGGKLVVKYGDQWEYVCKDANAVNTTEVCKVLDCMKDQKVVDEREIAKEIKVEIKCPEKYQYIYQCMKPFNEKCTRGHVEIKCEGYKEIVQSPGNSGLIVGLSLGMLGLLIMVFMWMNRKRLLLVLRNYRNKNGKDNIDRNEMKSMEKDRDLSQGKDYEDVDSVNNKGEEDADDRSEGSSGTEYDDIEGQNSDISPHQTQAEDDLPLLPKRHDDILADQDTYEVETEKQEEDYDDVMPVENAGMADTQALVDVAVGAGTDSEAGTGVNADAVVVTTEVEVHAEQE